jgi:hypothetical protein
MSLRDCWEVTNFLVRERGWSACKNCGAQFGLDISLRPHTHLVHHLFEAPNCQRHEDFEYGACIVVLAKLAEFTPSRS